MEIISQYLFLMIVGTVAGLLNVMAGGGSNITLPVLIFMGMDSAMANGTNRIALLIQNISAILSFKNEKYSQFKHSLKLALPTLPGAIAGAIVAVKIDNMLFQKILGLVMLGIVLTLILPTAKRKDVENTASQPAWPAYLALFGIGFYGGFIQAGVGFLIMAALRHLLDMDLIHVNMHKVFIIFVYTLPTIVIFAMTNNMTWSLGLILGIGHALGAWWAAKLSIKKGEKTIRIFLVLAIAIMAVKLLGFF
jgi:uncharacterized protein